MSSNNPNAEQDALLSQSQQVQSNAKDAERLDWLAQSNWYVGPEPDTDEAGGVIGYNNKNYATDSLRGAIDAAIATANKGSGTNE